MNKENKPQFELISKYLAGEATSGEAMQLHESLKHQNYKDEYEKISQLWNYLPKTSAIQIPPVAEEWIELDKKIKHSEKFKIRKLIFYRFIIAASIIGLILMVSYTWFISSKKEQIAHNNKQPNIIKAATDEVRTDTLPDGSIIIMNKNSSVLYAPDFNNKTRELVLRGESYFNVIPDETKPFLIAVDKLRIKVVGTSFNVRNHFPDESIEVQVQSGIVKMYTTQKEITVIKGQTGVYNRHVGELNVKDTFDVNSISYATKTFSFNDLSFVDACRYLEKAFNVVIKINAEKFSDCRLSAEFNNKSLDYILDIISATLDSSYKKQGNTIYIIGKGCQ